MLTTYINYAKFVNSPADVVDWINKHLAAYLKDNPEDQSEIEHIIDYLASDSRPARISRMSYAQAKANAEKWVESLNKKGAEVEEKPEDVGTALDFGDGFKFVKLIGKSAYDREGFLMRHCVAGYFGKDVEIYSLRDEKNQPHCTIEWGNQIKGKGNGSVHPKYVDYVVRFLEHKEMPMRDSDMQNIGYLALSPEEKEFVLSIKNPEVTPKFYKDKFLFIN